MRVLRAATRKCLSMNRHSYAGNIILYQNDRKGSTATTRQGRENVGEYSSWYRI